jgi:hypothetical protein
MFRTLTFLLGLFVSTTGNAQDQIKTHAGQTVPSKVVAVTPSSVQFSYAGETSLQTMPRHLVQSIQYGSGRQETLSELVVVGGEADWEKVVLTDNPDDVVGLRRIGEVRAISTNSFNWKTARGLDRKTTQKVQTEAAGMGAHVVLLQQNQTNGMSLGSAAKSFKSGVAYTYPFTPKSTTEKLVTFTLDNKPVEGTVVEHSGQYCKIRYRDAEGKLAYTVRKKEEIGQAQ